MVMNANGEFKMAGHGRLSMTSRDEPNTIVQHYLHPTLSMLRKRVAAAMGWDIISKHEPSPEIDDAELAVKGLGYTAKTVKEMLSGILIRPGMGPAEIVQEALRNAN
jgi:hypothetical protein